MFNYFYLVFIPFFIIIISSLIRILYNGKIDSHDVMNIVMMVIIGLIIFSVSNNIIMNINETSLYLNKVISPDVNSFIDEDEWYDDIEISYQKQKIYKEDYNNSTQILKLNKTIYENRHSEDLGFLDS